MSSLLLVSATLSLAQGPVPYSTQASWESYPGGVTTGGAFADINGDGFLDLVVANGNDILRQRVEVYYNNGAGGFPSAPQWQSADLDYHGHLAVGDVNQDGRPDVAVSVFLGAGGFGSKGHVKLYVNRSGALETLPSWRSADTFFSFACDLGDADGDGDLDLAVATGEPYFDPPDKNRVYYNVGGALQTMPGWQAGINDHAMDVAFGDADGDGDLDLAFCTALGPNRIYFQGPGGLATAAGWASTDNNNQNGNSLAWCDVDGDGDQDLGVSDNNQLGGGAGVYKIYRNGGAGLATTPFWSDFEGYTSALAFADLHRDGYPDLAGGEWWGGGKVYLNNAGGFPAAPNWQSSKLSVVEAMFFGDLRNKAVLTQAAENHPGNGVRRAFYLRHRPIHALLSVRADGVDLGLGDFCLDQEDGWIALDRAPAVALEVGYRYSESLDLGVTNWDQSVGNLVFLRAPLLDAAAAPSGATALTRGDFLNFNGSVASTTNRVENFLLAAVAQPPSGPYHVLDLRSETLNPFASRSLPYSFQVPPNLPPAYNGNYTLTLAAVKNGNVLDQSDFPFSIQ